MTKNKLKSTNKVKFVKRTNIDDFSDMYRWAHETFGSDNENGWQLTMKHFLSDNMEHRMMFFFKYAEHCLSKVK